MTNAIAAAGLSAGTYTIDPTHTHIGFVARHAMVTKVRGSFTEFSGTAVVADSLADSSVEVTIKVDSVNTGNEQRDGHLRTNDFFDPETYPEIKFVSTAVQADGENLNVTGDLTIKETTKSVTIPFEFTGAAVDPFGNNRVGFEGSVAVNRKDWGVNWNAPLEAGGVLVSEKVTLTFDVSAIKAA
ncbi:MAG: YceI family protein [Nocardioidaceae bacterium]|nr:MAG: YceI family protein [Nocardioidaceae bacterium]